MKLQPVKAWAVATSFGIHEDMIFHTRALAVNAKGNCAWNKETDRVVAVLVTPIRERRARK